MSKHALPDPPSESSCMNNARCKSWIVCLFLAVLSQATAVSDFRTSTLPDGRECVLLKNVARTYGLDYDTPHKETFILSSPWTTLEFASGSRKLLANHLLIWLLEPLALARRRPALDLEDAQRLIDPLLRPDEYLNREGSQIIVLDPGHGGRDPGARSRRGQEEKDLSLDIAVHARKILANAGYHVYLTRDSDRFLTLDERCEKARKWEADLFVSIHMNSSADRATSGRETFILSAAGHQSTNDQGTPDRASRLSHPGNRHDAANVILGYYVHKNMMKTIPGTDRGLKRARFHVLKNAPCPSVLVECGFLSNADEDQQFAGVAYRRKAAQALATGILDYLAAVQRAKAVQP